MSPKPLTSIAACMPCVTSSPQNRPTHRPGHRTSPPPLETSFLSTAYPYNHERAVHVFQQRRNLLRTSQDSSNAICHSMPQKSRSTPAGGAALARVGRPRTAAMHTLRAPSARWAHTPAEPSPAASRTASWLHAGCPALHPPVDTQPARMLPDRSLLFAAAARPARGTSLALQISHYFDR